MLLSSCANNYNHKSKSAFRKWFNTPHYETATVASFGSWDETDTIPILQDKELQIDLCFSVLKHGYKEWFLIFCNDKIPHRNKVILYEQHIHSFTVLDEALIYHLYPEDKVFYSDYTDSDIIFYWFNENKEPLIEFVTNGPAKLNHFLYDFNKADNNYRLIETK